MPQSRVLVIGASGQVGRALVAEFGASHAIVAAGYQHLEAGHLRADLADPASLSRVCAEARPDLVLLAGGMCNVDGCELDPAACRRVNVTGTEILAGEVRARGGRVIFFSTDHVFDGSQAPNREADPIAPMNVYSASKAEAEEVLRATVPDRHLILRTSWVYGLDAYRRNFILRLVDTLGSGRNMKVPEDQWGSPTFAGDLARVTRELVERGATGTFHAVGADFVGRTELAHRVSRAFGLDRSLIVPVPTASLGQAARRPLRVRLDCSKLRAAGVAPLRGIDEGLSAVRAWTRPVAGVHP